MPLGGDPMARPMRCLQDRAATNPARANRLSLSLNHQLMTRHSQNRFDTGSPLRDSSQARLVAEAAFAQRPITVAANAEPQVVVIKRKKAIVPAGEGEPNETEFQQPMKGARTPRVFRVDSPVVGS